MWEAGGSRASPITKIHEGKFERAHYLGPRLGPSLALPGMQSASMQSQSSHLKLYSGKMASPFSRGRRS